jgi:hypothetical protein
MVATPARIAFVTQEFRTVVASDAAVKTKYGDKARDTKEQPFETFFDSTSDAQTMANERLALLKADRRRFRQDVRGVLSFTDALAFTQKTPAATVIDDERAANHAAAIVEVSVSYGDNKTTLQTWG